jgi:hypothetical protein
MAYNIKRTDGTPLVTIQAGSYDNTKTSLVLFGKNFANFGTSFNENMVSLLENFAAQTPPANPSIGQIWYDTIHKTAMVWDNGWQVLNLNSFQTVAEGLIPYRIYVGPSGNDANSGTSWYSAKKTISAACYTVQQLTRSQTSPTPYVILVAAGTYIESNPIEVPAECSIIGDSLQSVIVTPNQPGQDMFKLNSGTYVYGLTVSGLRLTPSALDLTPTTAGLNANATGLGYPRNITQTGFAFAFQDAADIQQEPFIQNCAVLSGVLGGVSGNVLVTPGGGAICADSNRLSGTTHLNTIRVDSLLIKNMGGIGIKAIGKAYVIADGINSNFCQFHALGVDGGHIQLTNSTLSYGGYALWSEGSRQLDNATAVNETWTGDGATTLFPTTNGTLVEPRQLQDLVVLVGTVPQTLNVDYTVQTSGTTSVILFTTAPANLVTITAYIKYSSLVDASGVKLSYAGSGLTPYYMGPDQDGVGQANPNQYTIQQNSGLVYLDAVDEQGDVYMGVVSPGAVTNNVQADATPSLRIGQRTGRIDGITWYQNVFAAMTPFIFALTRKPQG